HDVDRAILLPIEDRVAVGREILEERLEGRESHRGLDGHADRRDRAARADRLDALGLANIAHARERHRLHRVPPSRMSRFAPRLVSYTPGAAAPRMLSALPPGTMRTRVASSDRRKAWAAAASRTFFSSAA